MRGTGYLLRLALTMLTEWLGFLSGQSLNEYAVVSKTALVQYVIAWKSAAFTANDAQR